MGNDKYLHDFDPQKQYEYLMHLNANNFYGFAISRPLPYANFEWVENFNVATILNKS